MLRVYGLAICLTVASASAIDANRNSGENSRYQSQYDELPSSSEEQASSQPIQCQSHSGLFDSNEPCVQNARSGDTFLTDAEGGQLGPGFPPKPVGYQSKRNLTDGEETATEQFLVGRFLEESPPGPSPPLARRPRPKHFNVVLSSSIQVGDDKKVTKKRNRPLIIKPYEMKNSQEYSRIQEEESEEKSLGNSEDVDYPEEERENSSNEIEGPNDNSDALYQLKNQNSNRPYLRKEYSGSEVPKDSVKNCDEQNDVLLKDQPQSDYPEYDDPENSDYSHEENSNPEYSEEEENSYSNCSLKEGDRNFDELCVERRQPYNQKIPQVSGNPQRGIKIIIENSPHSFENTRNVNRGTQNFENANLKKFEKAEKTQNEPMLPLRESDIIQSNRVYPARHEVEALSNSEENENGILSDHNRNDETQVNDEDYSDENISEGGGSPQADYSEEKNGIHSSEQPEGSVEEGHYSGEEEIKKEPVSEDGGRYTSLENSREEEEEEHSDDLIELPPNDYIIPGKPPCDDTKSIEYDYDSAEYDDLPDYANYNASSEQDYKDNQSKSDEEQDRSDELSSKPDSDSSKEDELEIDRLRAKVSNNVPTKPNYEYKKIKSTEEQDKSDELSSRPDYDSSKGQELEIDRITPRIPNNIPNTSNLQYKKIKSIEDFDTSTLFDEDLPSYEEIKPTPTPMKFHVTTIHDLQKIPKQRENKPKIIALKSTHHPSKATYRPKTRGDDYDETVGTTVSMDLKRLKKPTEATKIKSPQPGDVVSFTRPMPLPLRLGPVSWMTTTTAPATAAISAHGIIKPGGSIITRIIQPTVNPTASTTGQLEAPTQTPWRTILSTREGSALTYLQPPPHGQAHSWSFRVSRDATTGVSQVHKISS